MEFAADQSFAIEDYLIGKMARCFGTSEELAFVNGTGENQPIGILHDTEGAETGVTTENASSISYDEIIKLYLLYDKKYRKHGTWLMNDETALALRTLKDSAGNYLWKDINETIFSKPVQIVDSMPSIGKGQKVIAFGDFQQLLVGSEISDDDPYTERIVCGAWTGRIFRVVSIRTGN